MSQDSKAIGKSDDDAKVLIIEALAGDHTYGFDIDSIYYIEAEQQWVVIEFLKCDHQSVRPAKSHPRRYWYNWRKFASLWRLAQRLNAELYLVNYEAEAHATAQGRAAREFAVIRVLEMTPTETGGITKEEIEVLDFAGFSRWFRSINNRARQRA
jgi:hypothetical protein